MDTLARSIIKELQTDARQSFREIGRNLDVSEGTVRNRVKSLVTGGTMRVGAVLNPEKIGLSFQCVMCMEVKVGAAQKVEEQLIKSPNVYFLCGCTGTYDLIGLFMFHNPAEFDAFVKDVIAPIPDIVRTSTFVVMHVSRSPWEDDIDVSAFSLEASVNSEASES